MVAKIASSLGLTSPKDAVQNLDGRSPTPSVITSVSNTGAIKPNGPVADVLLALQSNTLSPATVLGAVTSAIIRATDDVCNNNMSNRSRGSGNMRRRRNGIHSNCEMTAKGRIERALGISLASIPEFATDAATNIAMAYKDKLQFLPVEGLVNAAGDLMEIHQSGQGNEATALAKVASKFFNTPELGEFVDQRANLAVSVTLLDAALNLGAFDIIDKAMDKYRGQPAIRQTMMENIPLVIIRSDLRTLNKIMDELGAVSVLKAVPNAPTEILRYYQYPVGTDTKRFGEYRDLLLSTLARINPTWDETNGKINLSPFIFATRHAKTLLSLPLPATTDATYFDDTYVRECRVAEHYRVQTPAVLARSMYRYLAI